MNIYRNAINSFQVMDRLIMACLRNPVDCAQAIDNMNQPRFNWQVFLKKIFTEGVDGVLFDNLSKWNFGEKLPAWVWDEIKQNYLRNLGRNLLITNHLENVFQVFEDNKIDVLLLRGADFLSRFYPKLGSRAMSDVDLVARKEDLEKVNSLLESLGYRHPKGYVYLFSNNALFIDLHADYIGSYKLARNSRSPSIKDKDIWQEAIPFKSNSVCVKVLSVYDSVINCCAHLQEHSFSKLIWFYDIRNMIAGSKTEFDWKKLIYKARQYDLEKPIFYVLSYLEANQILILTSEVRAEFALIGLNRFEKKSLLILLQNQRRDVSGELLYLFSKKGFVLKVKCLWQSIFIDKASFHLAVEKITIEHYLRRLLAMISYGIRKIFKLIIA